MQCSAFLHERGGGWQSLIEGDVLGPSGPVHIESGERLMPVDTSAKGEIARALNDLCENH